MEKGLQNNSTKTSLQKSLPAEIILNEQPDKKLLIAEISSLLLRLVKLYQIPNFDEMSSVLLSEWICDNYKFDSFKRVKACLQNPPRTEEKNWRLTPDTIREWMATELEKEAADRERINNLYKTKDADELYQAPNIPEHVNQLIEDYKNQLAGPQGIRSITEKEIKEEGRERPKKKEYVSPAQDYVNDWREKVRIFQERTVRERHPEMTEDQIRERLKELEKTLPF